MQMKTRGTLISIISIGLIATMLGAGTFTFYEDIENTVTNTLIAGEVDLAIDCESYHWGNDGLTNQPFEVSQAIQFDEQRDLADRPFFTWDDVKPGDYGIAKISLHSISNDAWLWFQTCEITQGPGDTPEPEGNPADDNGELADNILISAWFENDGNMQYDSGETELFPEDSLSAFFTSWTSLLGPYHLIGCETIYLCLDWQVPENVGNCIQDDWLTFNMRFYAEQWRNNPSPIGPGSLCDAVGYWKMDDGSGDTVTDSSGNNNHGTLMPDSPVWTSDGVINGALDFDGVDDYVEVGDDPSLDITDEITLMAWVYPENWDNTYENGILTKAGDEDYGVWNLHYKWEEIAHSGFRFEAKIDGNTENIFEITPSEDLNTWYHVAGVYDGSEMKLFINGQKVNSKEVNGPISTNDQPLRFGKQFWWNNIYSMWNGSMDEIKIYDYALSDAEIEYTYEHGYQFIDDTESTTETITINNPGPQYETDQYGYNFDYLEADVQFTYNLYDTTLRGTIDASGLKPYCTYQVKLIGIPDCHPDFLSGDNDANEYIGYKGRWTCVSCDCLSSSCNRNDAQYEARSPYRGDGSECIAGYLVFDYFTADENGDAHKLIEAKTSYHVLYAGGGICDSINNNDLYYPDANYPSLAFCPPDKVNGQPESGRGGCNGLDLDPGYYNCQIALTEESFHRGNWATVLDGMIEFNII